MKKDAAIVRVKLPVKMAREVVAICEQQDCSTYTYILSLIQRDIASRRESGWNMREGWDGRAKLEAERAASFQEMLARA